jgi:hypothetical protein
MADIRGGDGLSDAESRIARSLLHLETLIIQVPREHL